MRRVIVRIMLLVFMLSGMLLLVSSVIGSVLPAGGQLAYMSYVDIYWQIMIMDVERGLSDQLTFGNSNNRYPAWSPDGSRLAFHSDRDGNHYELYVMDADGRNLRRLTDENMFRFAADNQPSYMLGNAMAAWSPDGQRIAYHSDVGGDWDLFMMSPDGQEIERLTSRYGDEVLFSWSPDGTKGLFSMSEAEIPNVMHIYVMDMEDREIRQLTFDDTLSDLSEVSIPRRVVPSPEVTPDPSMPQLRPEIAATAAALNNPSLAQIPSPAVGSTTSTIPTQISIMQDWHPEWSPDGTKIVFAAERDSYSDNIFVYNMLDGEVTQITEGLYTDHNPVWSPDGTKIVFASDREGVQQIFIIDSDGQNLKLLTGTRYETNAPAWKP